MASLVFDLECIVDPVIGPYVPKEGRDSFAPPPYWQIVAFGAAWLDEAHCTRSLRVIGENEPETVSLDRFVAMTAKHSPRLVGVNSRGYDVPVIAARCMRHGIRWPWYYGGLRGADPRYRYGDAHLDLTDFLSDYGAGRKGSLDAWAKLVGFPGKLDTNGGDVAGLWAAGNRERVYAYCLADVAQTVALYLRVLLLRGDVDIDGYATAARSLLAAIDAEPRLAMLGERIDRAAFLLGETEQGMEAAQ